jgi:hypothetical protein
MLVTIGSTATIPAAIVTALNVRGQSPAMAGSPAKMLLSVPYYLLTFTLPAAL